MRAKLVKIGNSKGVRLPKPILEASGLTDDVEIEVEKGRIVLMPAKRRPREGWTEDARRMVANGDDVDPFKGATGLNSWDEEGWTWPEDHPWPEESDDMMPISSPSIRSKDPK
jgi:antitoxin MazE